MAVSPKKLASNKRYDDATYSKQNFRLRLDDDADIIKSIKDAQERGINKRQWLRALYDGANPDKVVEKEVIREIPVGLQVEEAVDAILSHRGYLDRTNLTGILNKVSGRKSKE